MQASPDRNRHQRVVARVEFHLVHAPPRPIMAVQLGRMQIGQAGMGLHVGTAQFGTQRRQAAGVQCRCVEFERVLQRLIAREQVVIDQRIWLVEDFMGGVHDIYFQQVSRADLTMQARRCQRWSD